jgi:AraC-like DNA-binding protein
VAAQRANYEGPELLLAGTLPLAEIALVTGFAEQSHFNRVFKSVTGSSPAVWRREHRRPDPSKFP